MTIYDYTTPARPQPLNADVTDMKRDEDNRVYVIVT